MIHLAYPLGLFALAALPVLLLLYSLRPRRRRVVVPSSVLWSEALRERQRGIGLQRLLRNLSLLALLLFAIALALALADPGWVTRTAETGDTVLIVDVSASMQADEGGATRFEEAWREAQRRIDSLADGSRLLLMTSGRHPRLLSSFESDKETLRNALSQLAPTDESGRPKAALRLGASLLRNREGGRVVFITDAAFDEEPDIATGGTEYHVVGSSARNVAITRFDLRREAGAGDRFQILLAVRNYTDEALSVPASVHLDELPILEETIELSPRGERVLVVPFSGHAAGRASAGIDIDDDLAADNRAFAVLGIDEPIRVALHSGGNFYLESALAAIPNVLLTRRDIADSHLHLERDARIHDLVVVDGGNLPELPPGAWLLVDSVPPALSFRQTGEPVAYPVVEGQSEDPLVRELDFTALRIDSARRIEADPDSADLRPVLWAADTTLALTYARDDLRLVFLGFDVMQSNFPLQAAFPLFIQRSAAWLRGAGRHFSPTQIPAGESATIRVPLSQRELILRTPDGEGIVYEVEGGELLLDRTSGAGIYRYSRQDPFGDVHRYFAVTLADESESDIRPRAFIEHRPSAAETQEESAASTVPLWPWLAMVALLLLALEWWVGGHASAVRLPAIRSSA